MARATRFLAEQVIALDAINPQVAGAHGARLRPLEEVRRRRQAHARAALERIGSAKGCLERRAEIANAGARLATPLHVRPRTIGPSLHAHIEPDTLTTMRSCVPSPIASFRRSPQRRR